VHADRRVTQQRCHQNRCQAMMPQHSVKVIRSCYCHGEINIFHSNTFGGGPLLICVRGSAAPC
jgi:hypothetical protein